MRCSDYEELLSAYAGDELSRAQSEFIEEHLAVCADCRDALAGFKNVRRQLGALSAMEQKPDIKGGVMSKINGIGSSSRRLNWLRPVLASLSVVAIVAMLFVLQPWTGNNGYTTLLAKAKEAAENIQSYCVNSYDTIVNIDSPEIVRSVTDNTFKFILPDLAHLTYYHSYNSTINGVVSLIEENFEIYYDGEYQYYQTEDKNYLLRTAGDLYYLFYGNGGTLSHEHAVAMLEFLDEPEQLTDETIDGVTCLHYIGNLKIGDSRVEIWIGKDDYLIRQIKQVVKSEKYITTHITRYYNFNADITIELPIDDSGNLLSGWEKEVYELGFDIIPLEEALASITGDEDWSDPAVIRAVFDLFCYSSDPIIFFNTLPEQGQQAIKNYIENMSSNMTVVTSTIVVGLNYDEGILHYTNSSAEMDIYIYTGVITDEEGIVSPDMVETIESWVNIILASDPQAYFDSMPVEKQQSLTVALNDDSVLGTIMNELSLALAD
jgi:outer membrane lipoprotein-sorting protein